jgi:hypothetical protein
MTNHRLLLISFFSVLASACGGGGAAVDAATTHDAASSTSDAGSVGSCDLRSSAGYCQEYYFEAAALDAYHSTCDMNGGTWADAACSRAMAVGGCGHTEAGFGESANWFYSDGPYPDAATVMTACAGDPAAHFIAP